MTIDNLNISLQQFENISNGHYNAGQIDVSFNRDGTGTLSKINHHVTFTGSNNKTISNQKIVAIKECFIKALRDQGASEELLNTIKKDLGLSFEANNNKEHNADFINRRFTPLTRQQVKEYLDQFRGRAPQADAHQQVRQNVLNSIRSQRTDHKMITTALSVLSGTPVNELVSQDTLLKDLNNIPKLMGLIFQSVSGLAANGNNENGVPPTFNINSGSKVAAQISFSTVNNDQGQPILQAKVLYEHDVTPIEINFGVTPQQYLRTLSANLSTLMTVAPELKDADGISVGCKHLMSILNDIRRHSSAEEISTSQPSQLRDFSTTILQQHNPDLSLEQLNQLPTSTLAAGAMQILINPEFDIPGYIQESQEYYNNLARQFDEAQNEQNVNQNIDEVNNINENNALNQQPQQVNNNHEEQELPVEEQPPQPVQGPVGDLPPAGGNPLERQQELIAQEDQVPLPPDPATISYVPFVITDPKDMTSVANQIVVTFDENNKPDFPALKNILANNADTILSFLSGHADYGKYSVTNADNQQDTVFPFFTKKQITVLLNGLLDAFTKTTGIRLDPHNLNVGAVDAFKQYLENQLTAEDLATVITDCDRFITLNEMYSRVKKGDIPKIAAPAQDTSGFMTISPEEFNKPFQGYVNEQQLNTFLSSLAVLGKGNDQNAIKNFIIQNSDAFLTFLSGKYAQSSAIDMIYREAFEQLRPALCKLLARNTGLYDLTKPNPDFTQLTGFEMKKLLKALEHPANVLEIATLIRPVPESLKTFQAQFSEGIKIAEKTSGEYAPSNLQQTDTRTSVSAKDDSGIVIKPLSVLSAEKMPALSALNFIRAEDDAVRNVASELMSITKTGTSDEEKEKQREKLLTLISTNLKSLIYAVNDKDYLAKCLVPQMKGMVNDIHAILRTTLEGVLKSIPNHTFKVDNLSINDFNLISSFFNRAVSAPNLKGIKPLAQSEKDGLVEALNNTLQAIDDKLPAVVNKAKVEFQSFINQVFHIDPKNKIPHPYLKMTPDQIANSLKDKSVDKILDEARFDGNRPGMLAFYLTVIKDYFLKLPTEEIAKIFTSALGTVPADPNKNEFTIDGNKRLLEALFKGAGPLFQKMIQGMDKRLADKSYGDVFDSMKSNLQSMDKHEVQNILDNEIKLLKNMNPKNAVLQTVDLLILNSMGSATVAETFKCQLVYKVPEGKSKVPTKTVYETVVVKVMRPGVDKRVLNEKVIFDEAARKIPGVKSSWDSQIASIQTEFNFINEAENIKKGKEIYQVQGLKKSADLGLAPNVASMDRVDIVPPSQNILVLKMAEGKPLDKELSKTKAQLFNTFAKVFQTNPDTGEWITDKNGQPLLKTNIAPESIIKARELSTKLIDDLFALNSLLKQASGKWIKEALFNSGVFHNDMHGGNMMVHLDENESRLTVIDYGNLMKLEADERKMVKNLLVYTTLGQSDKFIGVLTKLMNPQPNKAELEKLRAIVSTIMVKGNATKDAGYRFTCILEEIRKLGLNLPPQIYSVTQGLNRLQSSLDDTAMLIGKTKILYQALMGDMQIQPAQSNLQGVAYYEDSLFTEISNVLIRKFNNYNEVAQAIDDAQNKLKSKAYDSLLASKFMRDALMDNFKATDGFFNKYGDYLGFSSALRKIINDAKAAFSQARKDGFKFSDLDRLEEIAKKDPASLSADEKKLLETGNKLKDASSKITAQIKSNMENRLHDLHMQTVKMLKIEPFETTSVDPKTKEPTDDFTNFTFYLEEVIGLVVDDVKSTLGTKSLLGGMGFFGGLSAFTSGISQKLKSDGPGGHVKQEIKL